MNNLPTTTPSAELQAHSYTTQRRQRKTPLQGLTRLLQFWYRIASPPEPDDLAPFEEKEQFRRGRIGSQIIILLYIIIFIALPTVALGRSSPALLIIFAIDLFMLTVAVMLNRKRKVNAAGIIAALCFIASPTVDLLSTPGGVNTTVLPIYGLLVLPLMCAVSFLPPWWVFIVAAGNCLFAIYTLGFMPSSGELHEVLKVSFGGVVAPIINSQLAVSIVAFLWIRGTTQALLRADRAEELAKLERDMALQAEAIAEQKQQLDASIQRIVQTHVQVANGDFNARVPLTQDNILWEVSGSLNNLLARLQRLRQEASQVQQMQLALQQARQEVSQVQQMRLALQQARQEASQVQQMQLALQQARQEVSQVQQMRLALQQARQEIARLK